MIDIAVWVWVVFVVSGTGLLLVPRWLWRDVPTLRLCLGFGLGSGVLIGLTFLSGMSGTLHGLGRWGILPLGTLAAIGGWRRESRFNPRLGLGLSADGRWFTVLLWVVLIGLVGKNFLAALTPEVRHDALDYHIQFPNLYAAKGGITDEPWSVMSYLPYNVEMLYTLTLLWGKSTAAKLLHFTFGVVTVLAMVGLGRRWFRPGVGLFAGVVFYLQPQVAMISNTCFNDLGRALFETLALALWFELWAARLKGAVSSDAQRTVFLLLVVLSGMSLGVKWASFPVFLTPLLLVHVWFVFFFWRQARWTRKLAEMVLLLVIPLLLFSPWCYRNLRFTGNPVYPFLNERLGLTDPVSREAEAYFHGLDPPAETYSVPEIFRYWEGRLRDVGLAGSVLVYLFLALVPLAVLARWALPEEKAKGIAGLFEGFPFRPTMANLSLCYLVFAILGFLLATYNADGRFLLPAYPVMALLVARSVELLLDLRMASRGGAGGRKDHFSMAAAPVLPIILIAALLASSVYHQRNAHRDLRESWLPILGKARVAFWEERYPLLPVLNGLPRDSLVLGAGFPARVPYIWKLKVGRNVVEERIRSRPYDADDLYQALRDLGVTHLFEPSGFQLSPEAYQGLKEAYAVPVAESGDHRLYLLKAPELVHSPGGPVP